MSVCPAGDFVGKDSGDDADSRLARVLAIVEAQGAKLDALVSRQPVASSITIAALFAEYEKVRQADRSWRHNRNRLAPLVRRLGDLPAASLDEQAWAAHQAVRAKEPHRFGGVCGAHTLTLEFQRAKELMKFGVRVKLLIRNPLEEAKIEKTKSERETWLDEAGIQLLLGGVAAIDHERGRLIMKAFILLCVDGMLRFNEARKLRRDAIRDGVVELSARSTKSKKRRIVGLTPRVLAAIEDVPVVLGVPRIFANPETRQPYSETRFREWFYIARHASGVNALAVDGEKVVIHTLRHSGATAADARGANATAIRDALGHSTLSTTERYLHRQRAASARELAKLMAEGADRERKPAQKAPEADIHATTTQHLSVQTVAPK